MDETPLLVEPEPKRAPESTPHRTGILSSFVSLGGGVLAARAVAFLGTAFLTRTLGPYGFGVVGLAVAICSYFSLAIQASVAPVGAREVARSQEALVATIKGVVVVRLVLTAFGIALVGTIVLLLDKPRTVELVVLFTSLTMVSQALITAWVYKGLGRNRMVGISLVVDQIVYVAFLLVLIRDPADVTWVPIAMIAGQLVAAAVLGLPLLRGPKPKTDLKTGWRIVRESRYLVSSRLLSNLMRTADAVLIGLIVGEAGVGVYTAAYRLCLLVVGLGLAVHTAYLPWLARASMQGVAATRRSVRGGFESAVVVALPIVVGGALCADDILTLLFGADFATGALALVLLLIGVGFQFVHGMTANVLLVFDRTRADMRVRAIASAINVALNLWWIPIFGIVGAAAATLVAHSIIAALSVWVCRRLGFPIFSSRWWRPAAATLVMVWWLLSIASGWPITLQIVSAGLIYAATLVIVRGVPQDLRPGRPFVPPNGEPSQDESERACELIDPEQQDPRQQ